MTDAMLTDVLRDWAQEAAVPHDLADRALGERVRTRRRRAVPLIAGLATAAVVVGAVIAVGGGVDLGGTNGEQRRVSPAGERPFKVSADTTHNPPQNLVAAGDLAVSSIVTVSREPTGNGWETLRRHYALLDPASKTYQPTDWSWVSVAPGLETAAVLEGDLPTSRIGILDMSTGEVTRWVPTDHPVASLVWSPDGTRLLATAYDGDPDREKPTGENSYLTGDATRTGFVIVDAAAGTAAFSALPADPRTSFPGRADLSWTHDATGVYDTVSGDLDQRWRHLDGSVAEPGDLATYNSNLGPAAIDLSLTSPDGRFTITRDSGLPTAITDTRTGQVYRQQALQVLGWADSEHVVTVAGCHSPCLGKAEFRNGLVLMRYDGTDPVPLTGTRKGEDGDWYFQLTPR